MAKKFFFILMILIHIKGFSQQLFQDASGKTNLFLGNSPYGWITFNTSDKSGSIGYTRNRADGYDHVGNTNYNFIYGGDIKINVKEGIGNILSSGSLKPGIAFSGNLGIFENSFLKRNYLSAYVRPSISYTQYSYVDSTQGSIPKIDKIKKFEGGILLNFNIQINHQKIVIIRDDTLYKRHYLFFGIQTGFNVVNNFSDLDDVQINTLVFGTGNAAAYKVETGKVGEYKAYHVIPINIDFGITPRLFKHNYFGFNTYFRSNVFKDQNVSKIGLGIYLADEKIPSNISGGFAWQFNDVFNVLNKPENGFQKSSVFFYVGYSIGK